MVRQEQGKVGGQAGRGKGREWNFVQESIDRYLVPARYKPRLCGWVPPWLREICAIPNPEYGAPAGDSKRLSWGRIWDSSRCLAYSAGQIS